MKACVNKFAADHEITAKDVYVWVDYLSIPNNDQLLYVAPVSSNETMEQKYVARLTSERAKRRAVRTPHGIFELHVLR